mmetsp:Transcript_56398/g.132267  ORF Transcript_56398/g.132267 Transcript_56398/m.132267 type:complete len:475 (-) Transcript_56398:9-1433(-)
MTKRSSSGFDIAPGGDGGGPDKAPRLTGVSETSPQVADYYVEQNLVGWVLGQRGGSLREVELTHQVKVVIDQTTKNMGYSSVRIAGSKDRIADSVRQIEGSLARMSSRPGPFLKDKPPHVEGPFEGQGELETIKVEQRLVGWIVGKGGSACREIEAASGCKITINQETKSHGYSMVLMRGTSAQRTVARDKVNSAITRAAQRVGLETGVPPPPEPDDSAKEEELMQVYMQAATQQLLPEDLRQEQQRQQQELQQQQEELNQSQLAITQGSNHGYNMPPQPPMQQRPPPGQGYPPQYPVQPGQDGRLNGAGPGFHARQPMMHQHPPPVHHMQSMPPQPQSSYGYQQHMPPPGMVRPPPQMPPSNLPALQPPPPMPSPVQTQPQMDAAKLQNAMLQLEQLQQESLQPGGSLAPMMPQMLPGLPPPPSLPQPPPPMGVLTPGGYNVIGGSHVPPQLPGGLPAGLPAVSTTGLHWGVR